MLTDVINYSGIVTKIRAMRSKMLTDDDFRKMSACSSVRDVLIYLKDNTPYSNLIDRVSPSLYRRSSMESLLMESLYEDYIKLYRFANSKQKKYLQFLLKKYEVDRIKYCIGIVFNHYSKPFDIEFKKDFFSRYSSIDIAKLVESNTIGALVENLRGTEYYPILHVLHATETATIFEYELALDLYYFRFMWSLRRKLADKKEVELLEREIGSEIDLMNLDWIHRAKKYYSLVETEIYTLLVPIHYHIRDAEMKKLVEAPSVEEYLKLVDQSYYGKKFAAAFENGIDVEKLTERYLDFIYTHAFRNNPYSMASIQGYLYFKEKEINRIIKALECIRYGYDEVKTYNFIMNIESEGGMT